MKKNIIKKIMCMGLLTISLLGFSSIGASAEWKQDDVEWWYANGDSYYTGWQQINGKWYYFYSDGYMAKNQYIGSYYLNNEGAWTTGIPSWVKSTGVTSDDSEMVYISLTGNKYYRTPNFKGDKTRELTLNKAKAHGYQPNSESWGLSGN